MLKYSITFHRLTTGDSAPEILAKLSEGNPGAMSVVAHILKQSESDIDFIKYLLVFDSLEIYGCKLYMLWNDCCNCNYPMMYGVIDKLVSGEYTEEHILAHINYSKGRGIPFETTPQIAVHRALECRHIFMDGVCRKCGIKQSETNEVNKWQS